MKLKYFFITTILLTLYTGSTLLAQNSLVDKLIEARERGKEQRGEGFKKIYGTASTPTPEEGLIAKRLESSKYEVIHQLHLKSGETLEGNEEYVAHDYYDVTLKDGTRV